MFCPGCAEKQDQFIQYCRTCGTDLRAVRESLEHPDLDVASIASAREEIARAAAAKIKEGQWWHAAAIAPEVEKLFESPEERRMRLQRADEQQRLKLLRGGTITASVGLGSILLFLLLSLAQANALFLVGPSLLVFLIGIGIIINGVYFAIPRQPKPEDVTRARGRETSDLSAGKIEGTKSVRPRARPLFPSASISEPTTRNLSNE